MTGHKNIYKLGKSVFDNNNWEWKSLAFLGQTSSRFWMLSCPFAAFISLVLFQKRMIVTNQYYGLGFHVVH